MRTGAGWRAFSGSFTHGWVRMPAGGERGVRLYAWLLRLYPERLRRERGEEMLALYRAQAEDAAGRGARARIGFVLRIGADLLRSLPAEHAHARRARRAAGGRLPVVGLMQDLRFALRSFGRVPLFTVATLMTLAIGIGATTAVFGVVDRILLRPLPYAGDGALVQIGLRYDDFTSGSVAPADYFDLAERSRTLEHLAVSRLQWMDLAGDGAPERLDAAGVSHAFFEVLGAAPALGRGFTPRDDSRAAESVVVLSDALWRRRFGASRDVLGRTLTLNGAPYAVIGVMSSAFRPPEAIYQKGIDLWFPLGRIDDPIDARGDGFLQLIARGRAGVPLDDVRAELTSIGEQLGQAFPDVGERDFWVADLRERTVGDAGRPLWLLLGAVSLILVIACANVANLWLVRATERTRELAVRTALGAGRARLARQLLTESVVLAVSGGALGALLATAGISVFRAFAPADLPRAGEVGVDVRVLGFAFAVSLLTGMAAGLAPVYVLGRTSVAARLRASAGASAARGTHRLRGIFVAGQVAIAVVLLTGAGLLVNGFVRLATVDPGFRPDGAAWLKVNPPSRRYGSAEARLAFFDAALERVRQLPGVQSAGAIDGMPLDPNRSMRAVIPEGGTGLDDPVRVSVHSVLPGYFETMGIPVRAGRDVSATDRAGAGPVVVVNEAFARAVWPDGAALGRRFRYDGSDEDGWITVVGVVGDVRHYGLAEPAQPLMYAPAGQFPRTWMAFAVRHTGAAAPVLGAMRNAIWTLDADIPLEEAGTATELLAGSLAQERFRTALLAAFAAIALLLTAVGLYGTLAHIVRARRREMGIRLALGAAAHDVRRSVVRDGLRIVGIGILVGIPAALLTSRLLASFVFGISTTDPATFAAVVALMTVISLLASWLPARRAAATDPARTLRGD